VGLSGHTPVPEYIRLIAAGRYGDAYLVNWQSNVSGHSRPRATSVRARVPPCPHRGGSPEHRKNEAKPEPVAICRLKRVAADFKDIRPRSQPATERTASASRWWVRDRRR
jgi:NADPH-dependent glutamate synthase beta subunit-like oxidoreductase